MPPRFHPIAQRAVIDTQIPGDVSNRFPGLDHHLHSLSLELRTEPSTLLDHEQILSGEKKLSKILGTPHTSRDVR